MTPFSSSSDSNLTGRIVNTADGELRLQRRLISGSSGTIYTAEYTQTHREVAVKAISRSTQGPSRSADEFSMQEKVQGHKNIAHAIALYSNVHLHHGLHRRFTGDLLVFDLYRGGDLFTAIASHHYGAHREDKIRDTFLQVISAVEYCHSRGVSHRDIKPENILCSDDGSHVFLTDFGLATTEEMVRCRCGSPMYMSWECSTHHTGDPATFSAKASDVWSLGMILLALVTGHCAWESVQHTDYKRYRTNPDLFWRQRFPISKKLRLLLNEIFVEDAEKRIMLGELRKRVEEMPTFYLTREELANAPQTVKAVWAAYAPAEGIQRQDGTTFTPLGPNDARHPTSPFLKGLFHHTRKLLPFIRMHRVEQVHS